MSESKTVAALPKLGIALGVWWYVWGLYGFWWGVCYGLFWPEWVGYRLAAFLLR